MMPVLVKEAGKRWVSASEASWYGIAFTYMEYSCLKMFWPAKHTACPDAEWVMLMVPSPCTCQVPLKYALGWPRPKSCNGQF